MSDKQLIEDLVEMSDLIEDSGLNAFREFNINDLVRYVKQYSIQERIDENNLVVMPMSKGNSDSDYVSVVYHVRRIDTLNEELTALKDKEQA